MNSTSERRLRFHRLWVALGGGLIALVVLLSLIPAPPEPFTFAQSDKFEHLCAYGLMMGWFAQIYRPSGRRVLLAAGLTALGILLEFAQMAGGVRYFDYGDMAANAFGVALAWLLARPPLDEILLRLERRFPG